MTRCADRTRNWMGNLLLMQQVGLRWATRSPCTSAAHNRPAGRVKKTLCGASWVHRGVILLLRIEIAKSPEYAIRLTPPWRNSTHVTRFHEKIFVKTRELSQ